MALIKTPDQKVRVFISSTIQELAEERKIAVEAIRRLRLIPVLFELGARPHPPRDLYRAYLEQSHIFVALYWNSYGWVAPDMDISGLEDEFLLSENKPRLIYIKQTSTERQPRLKQLISKIENDSSVSYQKFATAAEFQELLENDLALLLSEKFQSHPTPRPVGKRGIAPFIRTKLIGREQELKNLGILLSSPEAGLITITGAGGTGKTRLSLQLIEQVKNDYSNGIYYVSLAAITDPQLIAATIANDLGLFDSGQQPIKETLLDYLQDKHALLLLDNFEQVTEGGLIVSEIMERCPSVKIIVTSRTPLHLRNEHIFLLSPLSNPDIKKDLSPEELLTYPSIELFIQRAREVNPGLTLDDKNIHAIAQLCNRLDGLPLAIELAAARAKLISPAALLERMKNSLDILSSGPKDLPHRQRTLRATIDWSHNLLDESCRKFFRRLALFSGGWSLEASSAVANWNDVEGDVLDVTEKLADMGLLYSIPSVEEDDEETEFRFSLLETVKEYALEMLERSNETEQANKKHAEYYVEFATRLEPWLWTVNPRDYRKKLEKEYNNVRRAFLNSVSFGNMKNCWQILGSLTQFWITNGRYSEALEWISLADIKVEAVSDPNFDPSIGIEDQAKAFLSAGVVNYFSGHYKESIKYLEKSNSIYIGLANMTGSGRAKAYLGIAGLTTGDFSYASHLKESIELGNKTNDLVSLIGGSAFLTEAFIAVGNYDKAKELLQQSEDICNQTGSIIGLAMVNMQKGNLYFPQNQLEAAEKSFSKSILQCERSGYRSIGGWAYINLGSCLTALNKLPESRKRLQEGLSQARERGEKMMILMSLVSFAGLIAKEGSPVKGAQIFGAVETLSANIVGFKSWGSNRKAYELALSAMKEAMQDDEMQQWLQIGRSLTMEQAISLALEK